LQAARATVLGALLRAVVFGTKAVRTLALWAGGDVFAPNHVRFSRRLARFPPQTDNIWRRFVVQVIFAVTAYCVWARKGVLNFLGCFAAVRVFRELAALQAQGTAPRASREAAAAAAASGTFDAAEVSARPRAEQPEADIDGKNDET
jgi:hypothetical protein